MNDTRSKVKSILTKVVLAKNEEFGLRLKQARLRRNWEIKELAERSGVSESTVKNIEAGDVTVGWAYYLAVIQVYGMISELDGICSAHRDLLAPSIGRFVKESVTFDQDL